ncbi:hypothetical protein TIFTF001_020550 [Ficus carica]|uniref:Uncharacterized protein n=1 Tax=Ficus carica TaxID=3494 RepID=A0AA88DDR7_FICCA|nr:hypothetical protein TIFTF001_020550 [Ficus carica]
MVLIIRFVRGVSRTPRARSSNPDVEVVALYIMLLIMSSTFIVPCGMGPSGGGGGGRSGVERLVGVIRLLTSDSGVVCLCYARCSFATGVSLSVNRGCIGATGLHQLVLENLVLCTDAFHLALLGTVLSWLPCESFSWCSRSSAMLLYESLMYDGQGPHGGRQTANAGNLPSIFNKS